MTAKGLEDQLLARVVSLEREVNIKPFDFNLHYVYTPESCLKKENSAKYWIMIGAILSILSVARENALKRIKGATTRWSILH